MRGVLFCALAGAVLATLRGGDQQALQAEEHLQADVDASVGISDPTQPRDVPPNSVCTYVLLPKADGTRDERFTPRVVTLAANGQVTLANTEACATSHGKTWRVRAIFGGDSWRGGVNGGWTLDRITGTIVSGNDAAARPGTQAQPLEFWDALAKHQSLNEMKVRDTGDTPEEYQYVAALYHDYKLPGKFDMIRRAFTMKLTGAKAAGTTAIGGGKPATFELLMNAFEYDLLSRAYCTVNAALGQPACTDRLSLEVFFAKAWQQENLGYTASQRCRGEPTLSGTFVFEDDDAGSLCKMFEHHAGAYTRMSSHLVPNNKRERHPSRAPGTTYKQRFAQYDGGFSKGPGDTGFMVNRMMSKDFVGMGLDFEHTKMAVDFGAVYDFPAPLPEGMTPAIKIWYDVPPPSEVPGRSKFYTTMLSHCFALRDATPVALDSTGKTQAEFVALLDKGKSARTNDPTADAAAVAEEQQRVSAYFTEGTKERRSTISKAKSRMSESLSTSEIADLEEWIKSSDKGAVDLLVSGQLFDDGEIQDPDIMNWVPQPAGKPYYEDAGMRKFVLVKGEGEGCDPANKMGTILHGISFVKGKIWPNKAHDRREGFKDIHFGLGREATPATLVKAAKPAKPAKKLGALTTALAAQQRTPAWYKYNVYNMLGDRYLTDDTKTQIRNVVAETGLQVTHPAAKAELMTRESNFKYRMGMEIFVTREEGKKMLTDAARAISAIDMTQAEAYITAKNADVAARKRNRNLAPFVRQDPADPNLAVAAGSAHGCVQRPRSQSVESVQLPITQRSNAVVGNPGQITRSQSMNDIPTTQQQPLVQTVNTQKTGTK